MAAVLVVVFACAAPPKTIASLQSPTPSPSPTPTAPLQASGPGFHVGEMGVGFSPVALSASGGVEPYKWTVSAGALPPGIVLGADGSVSGNPTGAGNFAFTIQVADSGDSTATIAGTIGIAGPVTASLLSPCAQYCKVELGCVTVCGTFGTLSGGVAPYSYAVTQGTLPAGTSLNTLALSGRFGGQPGYLKFTVQVTDALGATSSVSPTFWMYNHISLASGTCYSTFYPFPCSATLPFSGGVPNTSFFVTVVSATGQLCRRSVTGAWVCNPTSSPPPMFNATIGNGVVKVGVPGQPNNPYEYSGTVTLGLTDQDPCGSGTNCSTTATVQVTFAGG